jgi:hypothetical protein
MADKLNFKEFCPKCIHYNLNSGACSKIHRNIISRPKKFIKECNSNYFELDKNKITQNDVVSENDHIKENSENLDSTGKDDSKKYGFFYWLPIIVIYAIIKTLFFDGDDGKDSNFSNNTIQSRKSDIDSRIDYDARATKKVFTSDESVSIFVPEYFDQIDFQQPQHILSYGNYDAVEFIFVVKEFKTDIADLVDPNIISYSDSLMTNAKYLLTSGKLTELGKFSINGLTGMRYRLDGLLENFDISYMYNIIETDKCFFIISGYTTKKHFKKYYITILKMLDTIEFTE